MMDDRDDIVREALNALAASTRGQIRHAEWERKRWHEMAELDTDSEGAKQRIHTHAEEYTVLIEETQAKLARIETAQRELS